MTAPCAVPVMGPPPTSFDTAYLGKAGAMVKLRCPDSGYSSTVDRAETAHRNASGGTTVVRRPRAKRTFILPLSEMTPDDAETLMSYYLGGFGSGPWRLLIPEWRNQLSQQASTFGQVLGTNGVWNAPAADAVAVIDTTITPPVGTSGKILGTAVLRWPTPVSGHYLFEGTNNGGTNLVASTRYAVPYLADQPAKVSLWARTASGSTTATLAALGVATAGWDGTSQVTAAIALTTTWQRFVVAVPAGTWAATMAYLGVAVKAAASSPDILLAAAQIEYGVTGTVLNPWVTGLGVPQCSFSTGVGATQTVYWRRNQSFTLAEN